MNGEKLRKLREDKGLTRRSVSLATGLTEATIGLLERGQGSGNPTLKTVQALADFYEVPISDLLNG